MLISIIIPCYNEGVKLQCNIPKIYNYMFDHTTKDIKLEILMVDDGSTDNTKEIIYSQIMPSVKTYTNEQFQNINFISYEQNQGKGYAVQQGIIHAKGDYCLFMDTDLATDLSAIQDVIAKINQKYDLIIGSRKLNNSQTQRNKLRSAVSKACNVIVNKIVPLNELSDTQCGFKAIESSFAKEVLIKKQRINRFAFDVEYFYIAKLHNKKIIEIPVIWTDDKDSRVKILKTSLDFIKSLIQIRKNTKFYTT